MELTPEIDDARRPWHFKQLKWALRSLARTGSLQPTLFPEQTRSADELAFGFDHWASMVRQNYRQDLTLDQDSALDAVTNKLATMSRDGAEFDADLWTDAALASSEHWADVRRLASSALEAFEWPVDTPADGEPDDSPES
jgi:hypothetical protein